MRASVMRKMGYGHTTSAGQRVDIDVKSHMCVWACEYEGTSDRVYTAAVKGCKVR